MKPWILDLNKVFLLIFILCCLPTIIVSSEKDSLVNVYQSDAKNEDKVMALLKLSTIQRDIDAYSSIKNAKNAIQIANKIPDKTYLIRSYAKLGITYRNVDSVDKALETFLKGLELANEMEDKEWQTNFLNYLGSSYLHYNQNTIALKYFKKSYNIAIEKNDSTSPCKLL